MVSSPRQAFAQTDTPVQIGLEPVITGLNQPVAITHAGDGSGRFFITQQAGRVLIFDGAHLLPTIFLDISSLVSAGGEGGLLSVAFHPRFSSNGFFYVNYTDLAGDTVIARYRVSSDPNIADPASASVLLAIDQPFANHNGGQLQFGPDGFLYIGMGDGGSVGDPDNRAQNLGDLLGKMLRIDVDSAFPYAIPLTNPFLTRPGARWEIWALGLRNPWRFSFDRLTGDLVIADVGQDSREEIDFQPTSSPGGENYGWRLMEGTACFNPPSNCNDGTLVLPILEYDHSAGDCSITGGYRYRGNRFPQLAGSYFYADFCTGRIWGATENGGGWTTTQLLDTDFLITTFGEDESGELYVADWLNGTIYRIMVINTAVPGITSLMPANVTGGGSGFTLRVSGANFVPGSIVRWEGKDRTTTFVSSTQLHASIPASDIAAGGTVQVAVFNPPPGGGVSNALTITVSDFTIGVSPASVTVNRGQSAVYTVTITPQFSSFENSVSLACTGLPVLTLCSFSPSVLTPSDQPATATVTISTTGASAFVGPSTQRDEIPLLAIWFWLPLLAFIGRGLGGRASKGRNRYIYLPVILLFTFLILLTACGSGSDNNRPPVSSGTPIGTHLITITATSGSLQQSISATLIVR